jgi:hypothetical protein
MCSGKRAEMAVTADNPEPDQRRGMGRIPPLLSAWILWPIVTLHVEPHPPAFYEYGREIAYLWAWAVP